MKTIELVKNDEGVYVPKNEVNKSKNEMKKFNNVNNRKVDSENRIKALLDGVDIGLSFFEELDKRIKRAKRLF